MNKYLKEWRYLAPDDGAGSGDIPVDDAAAPDDEEVDTEDVEELGEDEDSEESESDDDEPEGDPGDGADTEPDPVDPEEMLAWLEFQKQRNEQKAAASAADAAVAAVPYVPELDAVDKFYDDQIAQYDEDDYIVPLLESLKAREKLMAQQRQDQMQAMVQYVDSVIGPVVAPQLAQRVVDSLAQDVPEEFLPALKERWQNAPPFVLQRALDPANRDALLAEAKTTIGEIVLQGSTKPAPRPVGTSASGAPASAPQPKAGTYTRAEEDEWASAVRALYKGVPADQLPSLKKEHFGK